MPSTAAKQSLCRASRASASVLLLLGFLAFGGEALRADDLAGPADAAPAAPTSARIRGLESEIARDRARLEDLVASPIAEDDAIPIPMAKRRELAEIAKRLPALQAELKALRDSGARTGLPKK